MTITRQEAYDRMVAHMRKQKGWAVEESACCYRTESGAMCAVGAIIPDDRYDKRIETFGAADPMVYTLVGIARWDAGFLGYAQRALHDELAFGVFDEDLGLCPIEPFDAETFEAAAMAFADQYDLGTTPRYGIDFNPRRSGRHHNRRTAF